MHTAHPAPLWRRFAAAVYDLFPLVALWMASAGLMLLAARGNVDVAHPPRAYALGLRALLVAVSTAYFVVSWSRGGQTIGMRAWGLRVVGADGAAVVWPRALLRFGAALVSMLVFGLGFLWCLFDPKQRAWHDIAAKTAVISLPRD